MEIKDKELHRITTTCLVYKPDFSYLITKRAIHKKVMPGKWTIPGGGLNVDDCIHDVPATVGANQWYGVMEKSLRREIREEVNVEIGTPRFARNLAFIRPDGVPVLCLTYFAPYLSGEVKLDEDATEFAWVPVEQLQDYDIIDGVADEIREIDVILKSRK
jgi:8-oxo-dGTP diphosphatase